MPTRREDPDRSDSGRRSDACANELCQASQPATPMNFDFPPAPATATRTSTVIPRRFPYFSGRVYTPRPRFREEMARCTARSTCSAW